jgi:glycosyltransferase involved in cell wall biosynthesis
MASGLAVVAYDYAAGREHIVHRETGLLVPFEDAATFVRMSAELATDPAQIAMLRRNARLAAESIDWDKVVDALDFAFRRLVMKHDPTPV